MINNINDVFGTEFDVIGGDIENTSPGDPTFVYKQWTTIDMIHIESGRSQLEYDRLNVVDHKEPYNSFVMGDRTLYDIDQFYATLSQPKDIPVYNDMYKMLLPHRKQVNIDNVLPGGVHNGYLKLDGKTIVDVWDVLNGTLTDDPNYLLQDYLRSSIVNRTTIDNDTVSLYGDFEVIGGPFIIQDPDPIQGELYKVFGTVQQLGSVPSHPTNVMIVNRSAGSLSTITVSPDPQGRFVKYYKDLPEGTTFMVIGLWDPTETPYYEPVIVDRIVATKL